MIQMNCKVANNEHSRPLIKGCLSYYKMHFPIGRLLNQSTNDLRIYVDQGFFCLRSICILSFGLSPFENFVLHFN